MTYRISVIIPVYNRARVLVRALRSVMAQTLPATEVIVVDDGSTDDTVSVVQQEFPEVICLHQSRKGVSAARNRGAAVSTGNWLAFLDSDDEWLPDKLEVQVDHLQQQGDMQLCHTDEIWIRNGVRVNPGRRHAKHGGNIFEKCLPLCAISPSSVMLRRSLFQQLGGFDEALPACEDYDLWLRICARFPVLYVDKPLLIKYGGHADQLSRQHWGMDRFRITALEKILSAGVLDERQRQAARRTLLAKCKVMMNGALKRNNRERAATYRRIMAAHGYSLQPGSVDAR